MALTKIDDRGLNTPIDLLDNEKIRLGTGNDLELYHDGSNSYLGNATGDIIIENSGVNTSNQIYIRGKTGENSIGVHGNGQVELYHDNVKRLTTESWGTMLWGGQATIRGDEGGFAQLKLAADEGDDNNDTVILKVTDGGTFTLENYAAGSYETNIKAIGNGAVELYHDDTKKLYTTSTGAEVTNNGAAILNVRGTEGNAGSIWLTADDGDDYTDTCRLHQSTDGRLYIQNVTASNTWENMITAGANGAVELYYDNSKKFETDSNGAEVLGNRLRLSDNVKLACGAGADLEIYHDGTNSIIDNNTGEMHFIGGTTKFLTGNSETLLKLVNDGAVELYYDNSKKFETTSIGATLTGSLGLGTTSVTQKLHIREDSNPQHYLMYLQNRYSGVNSSSLIALSCGGVDFADDHYAYIGAKISAASENGTNLIFATNAHDGSAVERLRIESGGNINIPADSTYFRIGADNDIQLYHISGVNYWKNQGTTVFNMVDTGGDKQIECTNNGAVELYHNGSGKIITTSSGVTVTGSVTESSDIALKTNIEPINNVLDKIQQITGYTYKFKDTGHDSIGVTAQDVEKVFPELVHGEEGAKSLQYSGLIGALIESVKELSTKVAALEAA